MKNIDRHNCFVRCIGYKRNERGFTIDKVYEVKNNTITNDHGFCYSHKCADMIEWLSDWYTFEILPQKKTYNIGDRVIASDNVGYNKYESGTIVKLWHDMSHPTPYEVKFDNDHTSLWSAVHCLADKVEDKKVFTKKVFTKKDLQNGDVVLKRNGNVEILILPLGTMITTTGWNTITRINDNLTSTLRSEYDIVAVRRPTHISECAFDAFECKLGKLVYDRERDTVPVMTIKEVEEKYGIKVKCKECCK